MIGKRILIAALFALLLASCGKKPTAPPAAKVVFIEWAWESDNVGGIIENQGDAVAFNIEIALEACDRTYVVGLEAILAPGGRGTFTGPPLREFCPNAGAPDFPRISWIGWDSG